MKRCFLFNLLKIEVKSHNMKQTILTILNSGTKYNAFTLLYMHLTIIYLLNFSPS